MGNFTSSEQNRSGRSYGRETMKRYRHLDGKLGKVKGSRETTSGARPDLPPVRERPPIPMLRADQFRIATRGKVFSVTSRVSKNRPDTLRSCAFSILIVVCLSALSERSTDDCFVP